eukprot:m.115560 g.115560  ORF g.115560 m.115560 type:complete len:100 (-) comp13095_c0_seq3:456-755(-)
MSQIREQQWLKVYQQVVLQIPTQRVSGRNFKHTTPHTDSSLSSIRFANVPTSMCVKLLKDMCRMLMTEAHPTQCWRSRFLTHPSETKRRARLTSTLERC